MVPTIIEFEAEGASKCVSEKAESLAGDLGKCRSKCRHFDYTPKVMEVAIIGGTMAPPKDEAA